MKWISRRPPKPEAQVRFLLSPPSQFNMVQNDTMKKSFYKVSPFHFVPLSKTPWGGHLISEIKRKYFPLQSSLIPDRIGESWEISTDPSFPSPLQEATPQTKSLDQIVQLPMLLKWIHSQELLSLQLHPKNDHPLLAPDECGKTEAWFVTHVQTNGFVYLGFAPDMTRDEIIFCLKNNQVEKCLHKFTPDPFDCIAVPPGCVHALGPGVFVAEPQTIVPGKSAKTWRISDWNRLYDGKPRQLHLEQSLDAIDWTLPRGKELERLLVQKIKPHQTYCANQYNPFALTFYNHTGSFSHVLTPPHGFSLVTVFSGKIDITCQMTKEAMSLVGGESALVWHQGSNVELMLKHHMENPSVAFFS